MFVGAKERLYLQAQRELRDTSPIGASERDLRRPSGLRPEGRLVEAAGQQFHLFRDGLDYAFIRSSRPSTGAGRLIRIVNRSRS
jgi:hypothetical protein